MLKPGRHVPLQHYLTLAGVSRENTGVQISPWPGGKPSEQAREPRENEDGPQTNAWFRNI